ncbi:MAG: hypothetical protein M3393_10375 [Actinomycetota bacterium]|nr:hypothetical protein [Actinomycetota bacterium]
MSDPQLPPELREQVPFEDSHGDGPSSGRPGGPPVWVRLVALVLVVSLVLFFALQVF